MTLALVTRGYVCPPGRLAAEYGPGPDIVSTDSIKPELIGAAASLEETPSIMGAGVAAPSISSAKGPSTAPTGDTPTIDGAGVVAPDIDEAGET